MTKAAASRRPGRSLASSERTSRRSSSACIRRSTSRGRRKQVGRVHDQRVDAARLERAVDLGLELALATRTRRILGEHRAFDHARAEHLACGAQRRARLDNEDLDVDAYRQEVERMARRIAAGLPKDADSKAKLAALKTQARAAR